MAKAKQQQTTVSLEDNIPDHWDDPGPPAKESPLAAAVADAPAAPVYTKCWLCGTEAFGSRRVYADTKEEAEKVYIESRVPKVHREKVKGHVLIEETEFRPAATEVGKPGGWPAKWRGKTKG